MKAIGVVVAALALLYNANALNNGLAKLPPMGWATWCTDDYCGLFDFCNEKEVRSIADALASNGMRELGYKYILLDDCWAAKQRDANDNIQADAGRFPSGIPALADYVHQRGLKLGLYTCAGELTCKYKRIGSGGHFAADAETFASWNVDYVKMDWCHHPSTPAEQVYGEFASALNKTGKEIFFSICEWGEQNVWQWGHSVGNSYRVHPDHLPFWFGSQGVASIIEYFANANITSHSGPGGWADPDFLMTGLFPLSWTDSRTEYTFWALWSAPMLVATDVRHMSKEKKEILLNPEAIAINQDRLGRAGYRVEKGDKGEQVWVKPLSDGNWAVALYNSANFHSVRATLLASHLNAPAGAKMEIRDIWAQKDVGTVESEYSRKLSAHESILLKVSVITS